MSVICLHGEYRASKGTQGGSLKEKVKRFGKGIAYLNWLFN